MNFVDARQKFCQLIQQPEEQIDLAETALAIAQEEYPRLDVTTYLAKLDRIATTVQGRLPTERYPLRVIKAINYHLYEELGFKGNQANYYDPRNSFLNEVLDRRMGIPITLSLVYLEVAKRINFPMVGVDMPAHFLIRPDLSDVEFLVDPFHEGEVMFVEDCQKRLEEIYEHPIDFDPGFLERSTPRRFLTRLLSNLKMIYLREGEFHKSLAAIERILLLFPNAPMQVRDRGILYYHLGNWIDARQDLQTYIQEIPNAQDVPIIKQILKRMAGNSGE